MHKSSQELMQELRAQVKSKFVTLKSHVSTLTQNGLTSAMIEQFQVLAHNLTELLKSKADVTDLADLKENKSNKQDTDLCIRGITEVHKMLDHVAAIQAAALKTQSMPNQAGLAEKEQQLQHLFD